MFTKVKNSIDFLAKEFLYNGHLQSLGALGIVYISATIVLDRSPSLILLAATYLIFQFIFLNDRFTDIRRDRITNPARTRHLSKYSKYIPHILALILVSIIVAFLTFSKTTALLFALFILILGYFYPTYFKALTKRIYLFKNIYVSVVYAILIFFPLIFYTTGLTDIYKLGMIFAFIFLESLVSQIALDSKDISTDKKDGLLTLGALFGKKSSLKYLAYFSFLTNVVFLILSYYSDLGIFMIIIIFVSLFLNQISVYMIYKDKGTGYALSAGKFLIWLLIVLGYQLTLSIYFH